MNQSYCEANMRQTLTEKSCESTTGSDLVRMAAWKDGKCAGFSSHESSLWPLIDMIPATAPELQDTRTQDTSFYHFTTTTTTITTATTTTTTTTTTTAITAQCCTLNMKVFC